METISSAKQLLLSSLVTKHLPQNRKWWSKYIYHFSHITNIASILNDDLLKCRNQVKNINVENLNDNASSEVISGTEEVYKDYVRFYFRPLTPTQFNNEGIRAKDEITSFGAHCPVPVFLLFDPAMLDEPNVFFSYESLASHYHVPLYHGLKKLVEAPFDYIYHYDSTYNLDGRQIRKHRQAEIVVKDQCNLQYLQKIVCRTKAEADTLLELLDFFALVQYSDKICYIDEGTFDTTDSKTLFHGDFLKILDVHQSKSSLKVKFNINDKYPRNIDIRWSGRGDKPICEFVRENYVLCNCDIVNEFHMTMVNFLEGHDFVKVKIKIDGHLVYCNTYNFKESTIPTVSPIKIQGLP
ncbi:DarT ssDNA thymidine ADP-ribosyltransferase family protein [Bacillus sp. X1(2014)]|uniref:DarT ssDNA thymidine ADP-ribosyltransferase family protein n=1 Tax=Bacillus sp. X1(2014) TaxID=1565991 RepID=UPI0011A90600|nr:DarT ssDNA thymidine ADP-ribosyltransferase family protein [Bacillus sp. X1(2014)]